MSSPSPSSSSSHYPILESQSGFGVGNLHGAAAWAPSHSYDRQKPPGHGHDPRRNSELNPEAKTAHGSDPAEVQRSVDSGLRQLERADAPQQLARLVQAWADGDVRQLERYPQWCNCLNTAEERADYARLIDGRNPGMARAVAEQLRAGHTLFVAVGAMHLVGPQGLPALLAAQGFDVQPVAWGSRTPGGAAGTSGVKKAPAQ